LIKCGVSGRQRLLRLPLWLLAAVAQPQYWDIRRRRMPTKRMAEYSRHQEKGAPKQAPKGKPQTMCRMVLSTIKSLGTTVECQVCRWDGRKIQ
jgi:hypothetical protein